MVAYKCKMCGANLDITGKNGVVKCEYCDTQQTYPIPGDERKTSLFNRANNLRMKCDFDRAARVYEMIIAEFPEEAEAFWGLCLCNYGIEYVDDPGTGKKVPTCHRASYSKLAEDDNYQQAIENADMNAQKFYRNEAREIDRIMDEIVAIGKNEKPYDVFICYKETGEDSQRTLDSVLAQDIYDTLVSKGYKVFFSRITLEDKLGQEYEPYIFSALNSSVVMLVVGMQYEHLQAVWVKNEWSRFLKLMKKDKSKVLIPCFKDMDAYDLPDEFRTLQAQDMGKVGAMQDLVRGIEKIVKHSAVNVNNDEDSLFASTTIAPILKRANLCLSSNDFTRADSLFEMVLNLDPENAQAYLGKLLVEYGYKSSDAFEKCDKNYKSSSNYTNMISFADEKLKEEFARYDRAKDYRKAVQIVKSAQSIPAPSIKIEKYRLAIKLFSNAAGYADSEKRLEQVKQEIYDAADIWAKKRDVEYKSLASVFYEAVGDFRDSLQKLAELKEEIELILKKRKKRKTVLLLCFTVILAVAASVGLYYIINKEEITYNKAVEAEQNGEIGRAAILYTKAGGYEDSQQRSVQLWAQATNRDTLIAGDYFCAGLKEDGSVSSFSYVLEHINNTGWTDIVALTDLSNELVGVRSDGTIVSTYDYSEYTRTIMDVTDVVSIDEDLVLRKDGTVISLSPYHTLSFMTWKDIVKIAAGNGCYLGLDADGKLHFSNVNMYSTVSVEGWTDVVDISAGCCIVGLRSDGTLCVGSEDAELKAQVESWTDIVYVDAGACHVVGVRSDGTVVAAGENMNGQLEVEKWKDIVSVSAGLHNTLGLKSDGKAVGTKIIEPDPNAGTMNQGQSNVKDFKDIRLP